MDIYSPLHPAALFMIQRRQREIRKVLARKYPGGVDDLSLLEVGCGNGQWLAEFQGFCFQAQNMAGIELDEHRASKAKNRITAADIRHGDASSMPWDDNSFDIVFQSTVFTSIKDSETKIGVASEMKRVCKKNGLILWYDFICDNPNNPNVKGVRKGEIKELFEPWSCDIKKVTLAPPISRRLINLSWLLTEMTAALCPFLRTHVLAIIACDR